MRLLFLAGFILLVLFSFSQQDYLIDQYDGQTVTTCSGGFYDSGGHIPNC